MVDASNGTTNNKVDDDESMSKKSSLLLSERMRVATKEVHDQSDKKVNYKLALVLTSKELYAEAISLFWPIYKELEDQLEKHKDHKQLGLLYPLLGVLRRAKRFEADIESLVGNQSKADEIKNRRCSGYKTANTRKAVFDPPELQEYIDNLRHFSDKDPILLIPYVYAMYGAITAGGTIIKRMVKTAFRLKSDKGVETFVIDLRGDNDEKSQKFANIKAFRNEMKRILDHDMDLTEDQKASILKEAPNVFIRNNALVETVQGTPIFATVSRKIWGILGVTAVAVMAVAVTSIKYFSQSSRSTSTSSH